MSYADDFDSFSAKPSTNYDEMYASAGEKYGVDPSLIKAVAKTESSENPNAISYDAKKKPVAHGLMQFIPATAKSMGITDPYDPEQSIDAGARLLKQNLDASKGDTKNALMMYHGGTNKANWGAKTQAYPNTVMSHMQNSQIAQNEQVEPASKYANEFDSLGDEKVISLDLPPVKVTPKDKPKEDKYGGAPSTDTEGFTEGAKTIASGTLANIVGGYHGLLKLAGGGSIDEAAKSVNDDVSALSYESKSKQGKKASELINSPYNPLNYVPNAAKYAGDKIYDATGSPALSTAATTGINALPLMFGLRGGKNAIESSIKESTNATTEKALNQELPAKGLQVNQKLIEADPVEGGMSLPIQNERASVLKRIDGLEKVWSSAVTGDVMEGATNAQLSKFNEPAGVAATAQYEHEYNALSTHTNNIIKSTGGTSGLAEDALYNRGQIQAKPFDALGKHFDDATSNLYNEADKRSNGLPVVQTQPIEDLLNNRTFKNDVMAQDKGHLLGAITDQLEQFKENNPEGLTVKNSEDFRKWLNKNWTNDNKHIIGQVKDAVDDSVMKSAGDDVYDQARKMSQLKKQTLENPNGIARLMETDPNTPINRTTPFEKIPDTLSRLGVDQFKNVIDTLKGMPEELQSHAKAAISEIQSHFLNKILDAGQPNTKTPSHFWNNRKVGNYIDSNTEKLEHVFSSEQISKIKDLRSAGNILSVDASYPGAAAQAANAAKAGLMSRIIPAVSTSLGGAAGSFFGPLASGAGALAGKALGEKYSTSTSEAKALKLVSKRMNSLSDISNSK